MASDNETFDEVFAEAMDRKAVRDYHKGVSNGMKLNVVRCVEDTVDHYAMRFRDAHDREVAELRECLRMAVVNTRIDRTCCAFGRECDTCGQSCDARKWNKVIEATKGAGRREQ